LEAIRRKFMQTITNRCRISKDWKDKLVPRVKLLLVKAEKESRACRLTLAGIEIFEVVEGLTHFTVDLNTHHCDCMVWDISSIPCKHATTCNLRERLDIQSYVNKAYTVEKYKQTYDVCMQPISDPIFWEETDCLKIGPPPIEIKRDRPQIERRRDITERRKEFTRSITLKCSLYKQFGHNKRSHRKDGVLQILKGKDRSSYKEKRAKRKVGRSSKEGPPAKKSKTAHEASSSGAASQPSSSKKSAQPLSSKKSGQPSSSNKSTVPSSSEKAPTDGSSMPTRQLRSLMQGSQFPDPSILRYTEIHSFFMSYVSLINM